MSGHPEIENLGIIRDFTDTQVMVFNNETGVPYDPSAPTVAVGTVDPTFFQKPVI